MKRTLDVLLALAGLMLATPVLAIVAVMVKLESRGPVVFRQVRTGLGGQPFVMYKLRTLRAAGRPEMDADGKERQVGKGDPRVTRVGRWLRRLNLDELPQLVNILRGEMSFVGPRPHVPGHDAFYAARIGGYMQRYAVRPGLTGWAQLHGLTRETPTVARMARRVAYDRWYMAQRSGWLDLRILLVTPGAMLWPLQAAAETGEKAGNYLPGLENIGRDSGRLLGMLTAPNNPTTEQGKMMMKTVIATSALLAAAALTVALAANAATTTEQAKSTTSSYQNADGTATSVNKNSYSVTKQNALGTKTAAVSETSVENTSPAAGSTSSFKSTTTTNSMANSQNQLNLAPAGSTTTKSVQTTTSTHGTASDE